MNYMTNNRQSRILPPTPRWKKKLRLIWPACVLLILPPLGFFLFLSSGTELRKHNRRGNADYNRKNWQGAIAEYTEMIRLDPESFDGYYLRARAYYAADQYALSIADETQALHLASSRSGKVAALMGRGYDYDWAGDHARAVEDFNAALYLDPTVSDTEYATADAGDTTASPTKGRMWAYYHGKQYKLALQDCNAQIAVNPSYAGSYAVRGKIEWGMKQYDQAIADFHHSVKLRPSILYAYDMAAEIRAGQGRFKDAVAEEQAAVTANPKAANCWANLGWWQYRAGDISQSIQSSKHALQLDDSLAMPRYNLGLAFAVTGDWVQAQPIYQEALRHSTQKERDGAIVDVRRDLTQQPKSQALKNALALLKAGGNVSASGSILKDVRSDG